MASTRGEPARAPGTPPKYSESLAAVSDWLADPDQHDALDHPQHESVFQRLHRASASGMDITLSGADVELLWQIMGDPFALADEEYEPWRERSTPEGGHRRSG